MPVDMSSSPCYVLSKAQPDGIKFCSRRPRSITQCANFRDLFQLSSTRCKKEKKKAGVWMGGTSVSRRLTTISLPHRNHITATWNEQRNTLSQSGLVQRRSYRWLCQDSTTMSYTCVSWGTNRHCSCMLHLREHVRKLRLDPDHRTMVISLEQEH